MCLPLCYITMIKLFILTFRNFGLFLVKETPEQYLFFMIYLQNGILSTTHALTGCVTTSKVVVTKNKKLLHKAKRLLYYAGKNEIEKNMIANAENFYFRVSLLVMLIVLTNFASYAPQSAPEILYWAIPSNIYVLKASYSPCLLAIFDVTSFCIYWEYSDESGQIWT